jgi:peptide/nickel transport system ATP-binding protein
MLERIRAADPAEPFWRGVRAVTAQDRHVRVELNEPIEPRLLPVGDVEVECHLHDDEARRVAERYRSERGELRSAEIENA